MRKLKTLVVLLGVIFILTGCFSTRTELFYLHIEEDTYIIHDDREIFIDDEDNIISYISIAFKDLDDIVLEEDDYNVNTFGDFSYENIKLFEVELYLGLNDEEPLKYDLNFLGRANPGRGNAYRFSLTIDKLKDEYKDLLLILEFNTNIGGFDDQIGYIHLQFKSTKVRHIGATIVLRNDLERQRADALKLLSNTFLEFKIDDYDQEGWDRIYDIYFNTRNLLNKSLDSEEISTLILKAMNDFSNVPTLE